MAHHFEEPSNIAVPVVGNGRDGGEINAMLSFSTP